MILMLTQVYDHKFRGFTAGLQNDKLHGIILHWGIWVKIHIGASLIFIFLVHCWWLLKLFVYTYYWTVYCIQYTAILEYTDVRGVFWMLFKYSQVTTMRSTFLQHQCMKVASLCSFARVEQLSSCTAIAS